MQQLANWAELDALFFIDLRVKKDGDQERSWLDFKAELAGLCMELGIIHY